MPPMPMTMMEAMTAMFLLGNMSTFLSIMMAHALRGDGAEQVDLQAADDRQRDAVDHADEGREHGDDHGEDRRHRQNRVEKILVMAMVLMFSP